MGNRSKSTTGNEMCVNSYENLLKIRQNLVYSRLLKKLYFFEKLAPWPKFKLLQDGLTQGQWERVIRGLAAIGCGMERHLERMEKQAEEKLKQEEKARAEKEQKLQEQLQRKGEEKERVARAIG